MIKSQLFFTTMMTCRWCGKVTKDPVQQSVVAALSSDLEMCFLLLQHICSYLYWEATATASTWQINFLFRDCDEKQFAILAIFIVDINIGIYISNDIPIKYISINTLHAKCQIGNVIENANYANIDVECVVINGWKIQCYLRLSSSWQHIFIDS